MQLAVVDSRIVDVGWLSRNRSCIRPEVWLARGWSVVVEWMENGCGAVWLWLEGRMNDGQDKDGYSADEGFSVGRTREKRTRIFLYVVTEQKGSDLIATVKKHGGNKQNEDWYGSERRGTFAAFPTHFPAAKVFYDLRLDLRIEHLPILRGYWSGRRGRDNERDAAKRSLRGRCAAEAVVLTFVYQ